MGEDICPQREGINYSPKRTKMIQPNELRIGNCCFFKSKLKGWRKKICFMLPGDVARCNLIHEEYFAIPLTPEILLKCGFKRLPAENIDVHTIRIGGVYLQYYINTGFMSIGGTDCKPVKYLHQLQNRIYSLTETELTFKP
jgi:hypothetical protein